MARCWVLAMLLGACGPIAYVNDVTRHASDAVAAAKAAEADKYAPYYYTRATQYLHKAHENAAHADYQGANRFGKLAAEAGELAEQEARAAKKDPSKRPLELKPDVAPAKDDKGGVAPAKDTP
jgi:sRNA-binding protein